MKGVRHILLLWATFAVFVPTASAAAQRDVGGQPSPEAGEQTVPGEAWAVLIGINRYQHPRIPKLRYAVNDAKAVERALLAQGFRQDRIFILADDQATKAGIEQLRGTNSGSRSARTTGFSSSSRATGRPTGCAPARRKGT